MKSLSIQTPIVLALGSVAMFLCAHAQAACPSNASRFAVNAAEVTDTATGLIWQRCSAGQSWTGTACSGSPSTFSHEQALEYARNNFGGQGWRLPDVKALSSLVDRGCSNPSISGVAFPGTALGRSSTAWTVDFVSGAVGASSSRNVPSYVRLVRNSP